MDTQDCLSGDRFGNLQIDQLTIETFQYPQSQQIIFVFGEIVVFRQRNGKCVGVIDFQIGIMRFLGAALIAATAGVFFAVDPTGDDVGRTSDPWGDSNRFRGTVQGAGAAFHAAVLIQQVGLLFIHDEHPVRAYDGAATTTDAAFFIVDQRGDAGQVSEIFHSLSPETVLFTIP
jgi:hypothetical protein